MSKMKDALAQAQQMSEITNGLLEAAKENKQSPRYLASAQLLILCKMDLHRAQRELNLAKVQFDMNMKTMKGDTDVESN